MKMLLGAVAAIILMIGAPSVFALSQHQQAVYRSGFIHGVVDGKAGCPDICHWYILLLGKGFAFHSDVTLHRGLRVSQISNSLPFNFVIPRVWPIST
jgi:hypothetical protein